jgi:hypothetical protein
MLGFDSKRKVPKMFMGAGRGTELRGKILKAVQEGRISPQDLEQRLSPDGKLGSVVRSSADGLAEDGFIRKDIEGGDVWYVKK